MRLWLVLVVASLAPLVGIAGCAELRHAAPDAGSDSGESLDGSPSAPAADGALEGATVAKDGGAEDAASSDAAAIACDGPCPPEILAVDLNQATALTVDATNVYFATEGNDGAVYQCPKTGCAGAPIVLGDGDTSSIVVDATRVYWGDFKAGKLVACAIGGCANAPTTLVSNETQIYGLTSDGTSLFWASAAAAGSLRQCAMAACTPTDRATSQGSVIDTAADQGTLFWLKTSTRSVVACSAAPCTSPLVLGPGTTGVSAHAGVVYWANGATKNVVSCSAAGCAGNPQTIGSSLAPSHPVSDGHDVYWRDDLYDEIYRCPASGCAPGPEIVATRQKAQPGSQIAFDGLYVYWTTTTTVARLRK